MHIGDAPTADLYQIVPRFTDGAMVDIASYLFGFLAAIGF
jgi:hypothetical protein